MKQMLLIYIFFLIIQIGPLILKSLVHFKPSKLGLALAYHSTDAPDPYNTFGSRSYSDHSSDFDEEELRSVVSFSKMRALAAQFSDYLCRSKVGVNPRSRNFSSYNSKDELTIEEEAERKVGWLLKTIFFVTAGVAGYHFFPYMGDNLMQQSVSLLRVKDPLFKRMGASRLARFAVDDARRKRIVEMGGANELLNMLSTAKDDRTRKEALHALDALSQSDEALASLHHAGAISVIRSTPNSLEDAEVERFKLSLMKRFQDLRYDVSS